jgi:hypothetical protein
MWPQLINTALGLWLAAAPGILGYGRPASTSDHIVGPLVATFACIAIWEATRAVRWINLLLGIWTIAAAWILNYPLSAQINSVLCGMAIAGLARMGGSVSRQFGGGWSALWIGPKAD